MRDFWDSQQRHLCWFIYDAYAYAFGDCLVNSLYAVFKEQDHVKATYAKKIDKSEGKISWDDSAKKIIGKINGLYPFPGAFFLYKGERYKILKAELSNTAGDQGVILNDNFEIGCAKDSIKVLEIQREGKKAQKIKEFLLGTQIKKGTNLNNA